MRKLLTFVLLAATVACLGAPRADWSSEPPVTYVLDYGDKHLGHPEWLEMTATAPPMLLHLGKDVPMTHNWGPIAALGGENQAHGKGDGIRRLSPEEVAERIDGVKAMVEELHGDGAGMVMPYICAMTIAGHQEARTGLWELYDHWADYAQFGLGERPALDVTDWMQRDPKGEMVRFYGYTGDFYPPYEPNHRYAACMNNPGWQQWLYDVARLVAECGYDGAFVDNSGSQRCYCRFCQEQFRDFLQAKYSPGERDRLLGIKSAADIHLSQKEDGLLWTETQRFWIETVRQHQVAIGEAARKVSPDFRVFPNGGHHRPEYVKLAYCDSDYVMFEKSIGDYGTHPGLARFKVIDDIAVKKYNDSVYEWKLTAATRTKVKPIILSRAGYPKRDPTLELNHWTACLGMAEAAAFGSGGGFLIRPDYKTFGAALNEYGEFFTQHASLYTGLVPHAQVGVLLFPEQKLYGNQIHATMVEGLTRTLLDEHVLFEYLMEEDLQASRLAKLEALVVPGIEYVSPTQAQQVEAYLNSGGKLLLIDPLPSADTNLQELRLPELDIPIGQVFPLGAGGIMRLASVPRRGIRSALEGLVGGQLATIVREGAQAPRYVRVSAWEGKTPGSPRHVYHILNYETPLGEGADPPKPVTGLALRIPAAQVRGARVEVWEPGNDAPAALDAQVADDFVELVLPPLTVYQVVAIR